LRLYYGFALATIVFVAIDLTIHSVYAAGDAARYSAFQVGTILTTTGFSTANFDLWPAFSKAVLVFCMLVGGSAGSTAGGLKMLRLLVIVKMIKRNVEKKLHPDSFRPITLYGRAIHESILDDVAAFFFLYIGIFAAATLLISIDGFDITRNMTAALSCISNVGPGLAEVGPMGNYAGFSSFGKSVLGLTMIVGRLEIFPIMFLFFPNFWRKR
jgi:trk system potassium uptake protein TrkH